MMEDEMELAIFAGRQCRDAAFFEEVQLVNAAIKQGARVYYSPFHLRGERKRRFKIRHIEWEREPDQTHRYWYICYGEDFECSYYQDQWLTILWQAGVTPHPDLARYRIAEEKKI